MLPAGGHPGVNHRSSQEGPVDDGLPVLTTSRAMATIVGLEAEVRELRSQWERWSDECTRLQRQVWKLEATVREQNGAPPLTARDRDYFASEEKMVIEEKLEADVTMTTDIGPSGVSYRVFVSDEPEPAWFVEVLFGRDDAHRPGGAAFVSAARMQEAMAWDLATGKRP